MQRFAWARSPMTNAFEARSLATLDPAILRTRSRADFVYESLRDAISEGRIACGERVREEEIARNLGVSRTPVREALQRLQERGLLVFGEIGIVFFDRCYDVAVFLVRFPPAPGQARRVAV